jgi:hypothetical protein
MCGLVKCDIFLDRRTLAELAITEPLSFRAVVDIVKESDALPTFVDQSNLYSLTPNVVTESSLP